MHPAASPMTPRVRLIASVLLRYGDVLVGACDSTKVFEAQRRRLAWTLSRCGLGSKRRVLLEHVPAPIAGFLQPVDDGLDVEVPLSQRPVKAGRNTVGVRQLSEPDAACQPGVDVFEMHVIHPTGGVARDFRRIGAPKEEMAGVEADL